MTHPGPSRSRRLPRSGTGRVRVLRRTAATALGAVLAGTLSATLALAGPASAADPAPGSPQGPGTTSASTTPATTPASVSQTPAHDALDDANAELMSAQMQLRAARQELTATRTQIAENTAALRAAQAASATARAAEAEATIELTTAGYRTQVSRYALENLVRNTYLQASSSTMPTWTWVLAGSSEALADQETVAKAESNAANATTDQYLTHSEDSRLSERIAAQTAQARADRQVAEAEVATRLADAVTLADRVAAVAEQARQLKDIRARKVTEARKLVDADKRRMAALESAAATITGRLDTAVAALPAKLRKVLAGSAGGLAYPGLGTITSPFGMRFHPILHYTKLHTGTDFSVSDGNIYAAADGVVLSSAYNTAYGNLVTIGHGQVNGARFDTWYAHMSVPLVKAGEFVHQGQVIGRIGATGYATGPHLHFEVRINGTPVDPMTYLATAVRPTPLPNPVG